MKRFVKDVMIEISLTFTENISLGEAWAIMRERHLPGVPYVSREQSVEGIVSVENVTRDLLASKDHSQSIKHSVDRRCRYLEPSQHISDVWNKIYAYNLVLDDSQVVGIVREIDVLREYAREAEYRLKELDAVFEFAHNGIVAIDEFGTITSFNPAAEKISKVPKEEAVGKYISDVLKPKGLLEVVRSGKPRLGEKYKVGRRWYITNRTPIVQGGMIKGGVAVFQDISEIEEMSNQLEEVTKMNQELEAILQSSYDGVLVMGAGGDIIRANRSFLNMMHMHGAELEGMTLETVMQQQGFSTSFADLIQLKSTVTTIEKNEHTGEVLGISLTPFESGITSGDDVRYVVNVRNLSELTELREALIKTRLLTEQYKEKLKPQSKNKDGFVAESKEMQNVLELAYRVANVDSTVLILGESGVGKEELAQYIHQNSPRADGSLVKINCGAIPDHLLESELFGYEPGAFTGAHKNGKPGLLEIAHNGTVLLDEVADLPLQLQVKLLRFLQDGVVTRVGGVKGKKVDVRIIAATNKDIQQLVEKGEFREDLYFRLNVVPITIPPLRKRRADILPLVHVFCKQFCEKYGLNKSFSPEALKKLLHYHWPGNVREMMNIIERCMITTKGNVIDVEQLPTDLFADRRAEDLVNVKGLLPLRKARSIVEKQLIDEAIRMFGTTYKAAEVLEVDQSTVVRKMKQMSEREGERSAKRM